MAARARSLLVPVADAEPRPAAPPSVAPVLPGRPVADRPQVRAPGPVQGEQYGVACPWCATPNNPDRHFCVRCAMPMTLEDRSSIRLPWWRRLFNRNGASPGPATVRACAVRSTASSAGWWRRSSSPS